MPDPRHLPPGAREAFETGIQASVISEDYWEESFTRLVPTLKEICSKFRQREARFESQFTGDLITATDPRIEDFENPKDRARFILQQKMQWNAENAAAISTMHQLRHTKVSEAMRNVR